MSRRCHDLAQDISAIFPAAQKKSQLEIQLALYMAGVY